MSLLKLFAVAAYCSDWHNGQSSKEYKVLSTALRRLKAKQQTLDDAPRWIRISKYYRDLEISQKPYTNPKWHFINQAD